MANPTPQQQIGEFIKMLRTEHNMTQQELADHLETSQSVIARIEAGNQNLTTAELMRFSKVLGHSIVQLNNKKRDDFIIQGGCTLQGTIETNTSKNGALGLLCASLINKGTTTLHGIPRIEEINRILELFESMGIAVQWIADHSLRIRVPQEITFHNLDRQAGGKIRSILMMIGALIHDYPKFSIPHAGGCRMGERTISAHRFGLEKFGVSILTEDNDYVISAIDLHPAELVMYEASDTATTNMLLAASRIEGTTTIHFPQQNYMVLDVFYFLEKLGVSIQRQGESLIVKGISIIDQDIEHWNSEDPIESMMFLSAGIVTKSEITVTRCPINFLRLELLKLEKMGLQYTIGTSYLSFNQKTELVDITVFPSSLKALSDKIHPLPYPGINVDNLPFFVPVATQAEGLTLIHDWMWENRAIYFAELNRLGADVRVADPHRVYIEGPTKLKGAEVVCPPALRPSIMILVAMLGAEGTSTLRNVYAINRGYEKIVDRLQSLGANIHILQEF